MCLVTLAIDQTRRFPLVIAANRDEFFDRPTQRLGWWTPANDLPDILSGRDLKAGGTWMGLTGAGRLALLTNIRQGGNAADDEAPSRGEIVPLWLRGDMPMDKFWMRVSLSGYNGFNLIAADFQRGECFWARNSTELPMRLERGIFGLSNASLDTPWPKVVQLKQRTKEALEQSESLEELSTRLFEALSDRSMPADDMLPKTGVPLEWERALSSAFIREPEKRYGTRCSTLLITERVRRRLVTHVLERTYTVGSSLALLRSATLRDWPPRYEFPTATETPQADITESQLSLVAEAPMRRRRSLLPSSLPTRPSSARSR